MKGSDHLEFIIDHRLFHPISTGEVEEIYRQAAPKHLHSFEFVTADQVEHDELPKEELLLQPGSHTLVAHKLGVPELSTEIERAVWQVQKALEERNAKEGEKLPTSTLKDASDKPQTKQSKSE